MFLRRKRFLIPLVLLFLFFGLPNIINQRENEVFDRSARLMNIEARSNDHVPGDSIITSISNFYETNALGKMVLGQHHRKLWSTKVKLPVFNGMDTLDFVKTGGGQQTTSVELKDQHKKRYSFRSINKDNSNALPSILKKSIARPFIRDQASALNPYSGPVVSRLLDALNIPHPEPIIYFLPYHEPPDSTILILGGEVVTIVEELNKRWVGSEKFGMPDQILSTNNMLASVESGKLKIDKQLYVRCRLFDFLVSDWDRHEKQWKWGIYGKIARPIPIDRDMAFCKFDDGWASQIVRIFNNKFQSYTSDKLQIDGLTRNSISLDRKILSNVDQKLFLLEVNYLQSVFTVPIISNAFSAYPPEIYEVVGPKHINIFKNRLGQLENAAVSFFELINNN